MYSRLFLFCLWLLENDSFSTIFFYATLCEVPLRDKEKPRNVLLNLLPGRLAEVDVIEKDTLQVWPEVSAHSVTPGERAGEEWTQAAICRLSSASETLQLVCIPSSTHPIPKHEFSVLILRSVSNLCRPL